MQEVQPINKAQPHSILSSPNPEILKLVVSNFSPLFICKLIQFLAQNVQYYYIKDYNENILTASYGIGFSFLDVFSTAVVVSMNIGLVPKLSQAYGAKDFKRMGLYLHKGIINDLLIMIPCTLILIFSLCFFKLVNYEEQLASNIHSFLVQCIPGAYFFTLGQSLTIYLNAQGNFSAPTYIAILGTFVQYISSKVFIQIEGYGLWGAAIAYNANQTFTFLVLYIWILIKQPAKGSFFFPTKQSFQGLWEMFKSQMSVGSVVFVEWSGVAIIDLMSGAMGTQQAAAYAVMTSICGKFYALPMGTSEVAMASIGNFIGEGKVDKAKEVQKVCVQVTIAVGLVLDLVIFFLKETFSGLMTNDAELIAMASALINIWCAYGVIDAVQMVIGSVLRSTGQETFAVRVQFAGMYLVAIPLGYILGFQVGFEAKGLFYGIATFASLSFCIYAHKALKLNWDKEAKKIQQNLKKEELEKKLVDEENVEEKI